MIDLTSLESELYRIWLVRPENWAPKHWDAAPLWHTAVEAMDDVLLTAEESEAYLEAMNTRLRKQRGDYWGVRVPIRLVREGDLEAERRFARIGPPGREAWRRANANSRIFPDLSNFGEGSA